ncbi:MAG: hypothetical protein JO348_12825 [Alphaproteobacteria bacterium]|nr:hypothetical protein [Alphaproteobacteria bacterium]MBV9420648.1 hypothetical protein [Alphaproteobacteria bacterium]MBV9542266.1 hypothetical protein [Alphaproteobacteria bacterium]
MFDTILFISITFWVVIAVVVVANGYFVYQVRMARYRVMQTLADKNQPVPPELFSGPRSSAHTGMIRGGIIMVALGFALGVFLWSMTAQSVFAGPIQGVGWLPTISLFPIAIGVSLLLMAMIGRGAPPAPKP